MPHYENVPFEVPEGWVWCKLGDISFDLKYGTSEKSNSVGKIAVLRMGNITNTGTIDYANLVYSSNDEDMKQYKLLKNDLLFNRTNSSEWVGKTAIYKKEQNAIYAGYLIRIRPLLISSDYLNSVMNSNYYRNWCYHVKTDAVNQSNINAQKLSQLMIPIPPLEEQCKIVAEIKKWISLIDTLEADTTDLRTIITRTKSRILELAIHGKLVPQDPNDEPAIELLKRINPKSEITCDNAHYPFEVPSGWAWTTLGTICKFISGYAFSSNDYSEIGTKLIRISNIQSNVIDLNSCVCVEDPKIDSLYVKRGDLLIAMSGATTGKMGVYSEEEPALLNQRVGNIRIIDDSVLLAEYRNYFMNSMSDYILESAYGGAQPNISAKEISVIALPLPPIAEQQRIVAKIEELFLILDNIQNSLEV